MAEQLNGLSSTASGASTGIAGLSGTLQGTLSNISSKGQSLVDRFIPPSTRESIKSKLANFAAERPLLASFLLSQFALSGLPLVLFIIMSFTVVIFALLTGILVGVIGALLFVVLALGFALLILLPTLFITTFFAVAIWLWGVGAYYLVKWFNEKKVPGVHRPLKEGLSELTGYGQTKGSVKIEGSEIGEKDGNATPTAHDGRHGAEKDGQSETVTQTSANHETPRDTEHASGKNPTKGLSEAGEGVTNVGKGVAGLVS